MFLVLGWLELMTRCTLVGGEGTLSDIAVWPAGVDACVLIVGALLLGVAAGMLLANMAAG